MTPGKLAEFATSFDEVTEEEPFGPGTYVYKVAGKIFVILSPDSTPARVSLKCEPSLALHLRAAHSAVGPGYHLNKKHWNTVLLDGSMAADQIEEMIEHSYDRVVAGLPKAARDRLRAESS